jgi:hypothetical protein
MCQQVQSVTLQTAVLMQVKEFAQNNQPFSVHDVTRAIRAKTGNGELEIPEVEVSGASFRFDIPHAKVKALFDELWRTGVFDPDFILSRQFTGMYFEYTPTPINGGMTPPPSVAPTAPAPTAAVSAPSTKAPGDVEERIEKYLNNCKTRNFRPTLKQVQSAIKRDRSTGWSCERLQEYISDDLGYSVVQDPDSVSQNQVATV